MGREPGPISRAIAARRSVRRLSADAVDQNLVDELIALACTAPAPHHSRPWRFVHVSSQEAREEMADAMSSAWRSDLEAEGRSVHEIAKVLERSWRQINEAPVLLLSCLSLEEARPWPDEPRRLAERDMFMQSLGAALQNLLLGAAERGLAGYLKGAPLFCSKAVREALELPPGWEPAFLVLLGYPEQGHPAQPRPPIDPLDFLLKR